MSCFPLAEEGVKTTEALSLSGIVRHQMLQRRKGSRKSGGRLPVRFEKEGLAGDKIAALSCLHIHQQIERLMGLCNHLVGVIYPPGGVQETRDLAEQGD